jgi:hypothetical protein
MQDDPNTGSMEPDLLENGVAAAADISPAICTTGASNLPLHESFDHASAATQELSPALNDEPAVTGVAERRANMRSTSPAQTSQGTIEQPHKSTMPGAHFNLLDEIISGKVIRRRENNAAVWIRTLVRCPCNMPLVT